MKYDDILKIQLIENKIFTTNLFKLNTKYEFS